MKIAEYIKREALEKDLNIRLSALRGKNGYYDHYTDGFDECVDRVENFPAADVEEVKHGKWVEPHWRNSVSCANCSICGAEAYHYDFHGVQKTYRYCPNCGAKMGAEG